MRNAIRGIGLIVLLGLSVLFTVSMVSASSNHNQTPSNKPKPITYAPGIPAIAVHRSGIPAFTQADVEQYIRSPQSVMHTTSGVPPTIVKIEFITAREASSLLHGEFIGRPDNALVCYVELRGPFMPSGPLPPGAKPTLSETGDMVFDAQTGNLLVWGP